MTRLTILLAAIVGLFFLAGCGQSGPLYLPGDPSEIKSAPRPAESITEEEEEEDDADEDR